MGVNLEKIEKGPITKWFAKPKAGHHKWMKRMMNKFIRRKAKEINEDSTAKIKKSYHGWEY